MRQFYSPEFHVEVKQAIEIFKPALIQYETLYMTQYGLEPSSIGILQILDEKHE